jgi:hypothetical protein
MHSNPQFFFCISYNETEERERIEELNRKLESSVAKYSVDKTGI